MRFKGAVNSKEHKYRIILLALQIPILSISSFQFYTPTMGWFEIWGEKMASGELYTTSFSPLPPLPIFILGYIPTRFNQPLVVETILSILLWMIFVYLLNSCTRLAFNPGISFFAVLTFSYIYFAEPTDIVAGYFELAWIFVFATFLFTIKTIQKPSLINRGLIILFSILLVLTKQNFALVSITMILTVIFFLNRVNIKLCKHFMVTVVLAYLGTFLLLYRYSEKIFDQLNGTAKKPNLNRVIENLIIWPITTIGLFSCILFFAAALKYIQNKKLFYETKGSNLLLYLASLNGAIYFASSNILGFINQGMLISFAVLSGGIFAFNDRLRRKITSMQPAMLLTFFTFTVLIVSVAGSLVFGFMNVLNKFLSIEPLVYFQGFKVLISAQLLTLMIAVIILFIGSIPYRIYSNSKSKIHEVSGSTVFKESNVPSIMFLISFAFAISNSLSGGLTIQSFSIFYCLVFCTLFSKVRVLQSRSVTIFVATVGIVSLLLSSLLQTFVTPYSWWGLRAERIDFQTKTLSKFGIPLFRITPGQDVFLSDITSAITTEKDKDSRVYFGPNVQGMKFLFHQLPSYQGMCTINWWDVCPEEIALEDFKNLKEDKPKFIVWNHFPPSVALGHESAFRSQIGNSAVRQIDAWLLEQVQLGNYDLVSKHINNDSQRSESWQLLFLTRNDSQP